MKRSAIWNYDKPRLDFQHRFKGYPQELKSLLRYIISRKSEPRTKFVIFGRGRSGSTLLVSLLNQHSEISCMGEILHSRLISPDAHVKRLLGMGKKPVRGFKLLSYQVTQVMGLTPDSGYIRRLADCGYHIVYLNRHNYLRLAISNLYARSRGQFHQSAGQATGKVKFSFSPEDVIDWMEGEDRRTGEEQQMLAGVEYLDVCYEDSLEKQDDQAATLERVCTFLGVQSEAAQAMLNIATPRNLRDIIENYDEVLEHVAASRFEYTIKDSTDFKSR